MIELDRASSTSIAEQLVEQLRFHLAGGRYATGDRLPSTRKLATQLDVSFHTVRKAYQRLEEEGLLSSKRGGGFYATEPPSLSSSERRERGAAIVQDAIQRMVALGLSEEETEYLFDEQLQFFDTPGAVRSLVFAAAFRERAEEIAEQLTGILQERVEPATLNELGAFDSIDTVMTSLQDFQLTMQAVPESDVFAVGLAPLYKSAERVAHLSTSNTIALVVRGSDAIEHVSKELRQLAGFGGQIVALPIEGGQRRLEVVLLQSDLIVYTPSVRRRLRPMIGELPAVEWSVAVTDDSLQHIRNTVGR